MHRCNTGVIWDATAAEMKLPITSQHVVAGSMQTLLATQSLQVR